MVKEENFIIFAVVLGFINPNEHIFKMFLKI